ncbi:MULTISPECIES: bifunctional enoyl-CoA hydratase/phosphate acetyltransferase [unclassified Marinitoga]|uniref:bifunctional enoyl-CoA hydratase/phosphate acetyltransferase n=1 Tax=unclassified Marinitoga TaxID=2640159 RepID=UPI000641257C|nr:MULTISPECIES: bifunctional enoyl-CoA hydratase/phosphate acetyltransferase [unclassified Marinitoga]KLO25090.1 phosphate butyryltransferase [Marinitoga sp. 1155]NUU98619.1 phosphate butyryltransferase [Marinitoga sp. 1154]
MRINKIIQLAQNLENKKTVGVAAAEDDVVLKAVSRAVKENICNVVLYGDEEKIKEIAENNDIDISEMKIIHCNTNKEAIVKTIEDVSSGKIDLPMKGHITTGELLSVYLKEEYDLRIKGTINLVSVFDIENYHKLLIVTDAGMVIAPTLEQKVDSINNAVKVANALKIENPKVAIVGALEKVNTKMPATVDAAIITQMNRRGQIKGCIVDGPFAMDNAISKEAAEHKGIKSVVAGDADIIIMPDIEAGNIFYKSMVFLSKAGVASTILGGKKPVVLTSRADSDDAKLLSIALSVLLA